MAFGEGGVGTRGERHEKGQALQAHGSVSAGAGNRHSEKHIKID
jgi:hypothetical protein